MSKNVSVTESSRTVVDQFNAAIFERHDVAALPEFLARDFVQYEGGEMTIDGIDEAREYFEGMLSAFPDVEMDVIETAVDENVVLQRFEIDATHDGEMILGEDRVLEPTGERLTWQGFASLRIEDGKIAETNMLTDDLALYRQLGLIPLVDGITA